MASSQLRRSVRLNKTTNNPNPNFDLNVVMEAIKQGETQTKLIGQISDEIHLEVQMQKEETRKENEEIRKEVANRQSQIEEIKETCIILKNTFSSRGANQQQQLNMLECICCCNSPYVFPLKQLVLNGLPHSLCPRCPKTFTSKVGLKRHIMKGSRNCTCKCPPKEQDQ